MKKQINVSIRKITFGKDKYIHVTLFHPHAQNFPTLIFKPEDVKDKPELRELIFSQYGK